MKKKQAWPRETCQLRQASFERFSSLHELLRVGILFCALASSLSDFVDTLVPTTPTAFARVASTTFHLRSRPTAGLATSSMLYVFNLCCTHTHLLTPLFPHLSAGLSSVDVTRFVGLTHVLSNEVKVSKGNDLTDELKNLKPTCRPKKYADLLAFPL